MGEDASVSAILRRKRHALHVGVVHYRALLQLWMYSSILGPALAGSSTGNQSYLTG